MSLATVLPFWHGFYADHTPQYTIYFKYFQPVIDSKKQLNERRKLPSLPYKHTVTLLYKLLGFFKMSLISVVENWMKLLEKCCMYAQHYWLLNVKCHYISLVEAGQAKITIVYIQCTDWGSAILLYSILLLIDHYREKSDNYEVNKILVIVPSINSTSFYLYLSPPLRYIERLFSKWLGLQQQIDL